MTGVSLRSFHPPRELLSKAAKSWVHNLLYPLEPSLTVGWLLQLVAWMVRLQERLVLRQGAEGMCQVPL